MPLKGGRVIGYNAAQMVFEFTMIDKTGTDVECQISEPRHQHDQIGGPLRCRPIAAVLQ